MLGLPPLLAFMGDTQLRKYSVENKPTRSRFLRERGQDIDSSGSVMERFIKNIVKSKAWVRRRYLVNHCIPYLSNSYCTEAGLSQKLLSKIYALKWRGKGKCKADVRGGR